MTTRTWKDNATEWVALGKQGKNVRLALLVACSVRRSGWAMTDDKATVAEFAELVDTTPARIMRHLDAWDEAAKKRLCPPSGGLFPTDAARTDIQVPTEEQFNDVYDASKSGGRPRASVNEITRRIDMDAEYAKRLLDSIEESHPGLIPRGDAVIEDDAPGHGSTGGGATTGRRVGSPTAEQRADRLHGRVVQLESLIEGALNDIRIVQGSSYAPTANLAQDNLLRVLQQYVDLIESRKRAA